MLKKERIAIPADPNDPEDFDVTEEALEIGLRGRLIRVTRTKLGLTQAQFAKRFHVPVGTLRDWEQSRSMPPDFAVAYVRVIARHPEMVAEAVG
jgi:putative transcriptional regulator